VWFRTFVTTLFAVIVTSAWANEDETAVETADKSPTKRESAEETVPYGPLGVRSVDSVSLLFPQATLDRAVSVGPGAWSFEQELHYASHEHSSRGGGALVIRDGEILRWELSARYGIFERAEVLVSLPFHYGSGGFLDGFITDFHEFTGTGPTENRSGDYIETARANGREFAGLPEDEVKLADLPVTMKYTIWDESTHPFALAARGSIQLPTGDSSDRFGSGTVDGGAGLLAEKTVGDFSFFASADATFQDNPSLFDEVGVEVETVTANAALAIEWRMFRCLGWIFQVNYAGAQIDDGGGYIFSRDRLIGSIGANVRLCEKAALRFGIVEDLVQGPVADVQFFVGLAAGL